MKRFRSLFQNLLWIAMVVVIVAVIVTGILTNTTLRSVQKNLPNTLLEQLYDLNHALINLAEVVSAAELTKAVPSPENFDRLRNKVVTVYNDVVEMRETYVFDNLIQASKFHAVVAPTIADVQIWLSEGVSGYGPETATTIEIIRSRISEAFQKAKMLNANSQLTAQRILNEERSRLNRFLFSVNLLFILTLVISFIMVFLLIRQHVLQRREVQAQDQRRQAEQSLRESEQRFRQLAEATFEAVVIHDKGVIIEANDQYYKMFGYLPDELAGIDAISLTTTQDSANQIRKSIESEYLGPYEISGKRKDGSTFPMEIRAKTMELSGKTIRMAAIRDLTEEKRKEEDTKKLEEQLLQAQKMESIGTLAGGIAHDFNNIIGIILGNAELAMDDVPEWNQTKHNLKEIRTASLRAKDLVRQLLSFARKTEIEKKPLNIVPIVEESLKLLRSSIPTNIEIRRNIVKDVDTILADPTQINQLIINLCTNANHAMPDGGIIEVVLKNVALGEKATTQHSDLNPGQYVNLTISDTGHGIPYEEIDRIFDPYFTTKEIGKGTGMGLAVVHGIVKGHDGTIIVKSKPGKGTIFSIFFPVVEEEAVAEIETDEELPTGYERILFIDDEESIVHVGRYRLERLGYRVEAQTSPIKALEVFRSNPDQFDLVITDMTMPNMTGENLAKELMRIRPDIPVILCTGFSARIDEKKAMAMGIRAFISKPILKRELAETIRNVLDG